MGQQADTRDGDAVIRAETADLVGGYLVFARELARRDIEQARIVTGLPRAFLEILTQATVAHIRGQLVALGTIPFVPRLPLAYWDHLARALCGPQVPDERLASYAAALSARFEAEAEEGDHGQA